jgi:predicted ATP-dependent protease
LLPASNVEHLMLAARVREAVAEGSFQLFPITSIDQAIWLLTGLEPGQADADGQFPAGSFNRLVADRLEQFARISQRKRVNSDKSTAGNGKGSDGDDEL